MEWEIRLFGEKLISDYFSQIKSSLKKYIELQEESYLLNVNETEFQNFLFERYSISPPIIKEADIRSDKKKDIYNGQNYIFLEIPFEGDQLLFEYTPLTSRIDYYPVLIEENLLTIKLPFSENAQNIEKQFNARIDTLKYNLGNLKNDLEKFNLELKEIIKTQFNLKKQKFIKENEILSSINFPLKERANAPKTYVVPEIKRKILIQEPIVSIKSGIPEPIISDTDYESILNIVDNMALVMERSPSAFVNMKEEDLRIHFLVQLNGQYEGQATGETFNLEGKTDILIRYEGKNIFIAECKFWHGKKELLEAVDQLLNYLSWRDTKTAIILFNKNKDTSKVLNQIPEAIETHTNYIRREKYEKENSFRFIMKNKNDNEKTFILTIKLFDVPDTKKE